MYSKWTPYAKYVDYICTRNKNKNRLVEYS